MSEFNPSREAAIRARLKPPPNPLRMLVSPLGWGAASRDTIALARLARECGLFPVFEAERGEITAVGKIRRRVPVADYLKPQKRFAHLFQHPSGTRALAALQAEADRNIRRFGLLDEEVAV